MVRGSRLEAYGGSRLEAYGDSRLLQFKAQGFVSSRLEALSVQGSRLRQFKAIQLSTRALHCSPPPYTEKDLESP